MELLTLSVLQHLPTTVMFVVRVIWGLGLQEIIPDLIETLTKR
jgi:hypothetical protein